jgi:hypothetical protein
MLAPFFGEVVSLCEPFGNYRIHDQNDTGGRIFTPEFLAAILQEDKLRERAVNEMLARQARKLKVDWELNIHHLKNRLVLKRLMPELYPYDDGPEGLLPKLVRAALRSDTTTESKLMLVAWATLMTLAPRPLALSAAKFKSNYRTPLRELVSRALSPIRGDATRVPPVSNGHSAFRAAFRTRVRRRRRLRL